MDENTRFLIERLDALREEGRQRDEALREELRRRDSKCAEDIRDITARVIHLEKFESKVILIAMFVGGLGSMIKEFIFKKLGG